MAGDNNDEVISKTGCCKKQENHIGRVRFSGRLKGYDYSRSNK